VSGSAPTVSIDRERCIGSGMCSVYAPGTFTTDDQAKAVLIDPPTDDLDSVLTAIAACPVAALHLIEEGA